MALLVGVAVLLLGGWLVLRALDDPGGVDRSLREAGVTTTGPVVDEVLRSTVPTGVCVTERWTVETAAAAYTATEGRAPADVDALVTAGFLVAPPAYVDLAPGADGNVDVVAIAGGGCD